MDEFFIRRAIDLAWSAAGKTDPNPLVGAVVVRAGEIVAEGVHEKAGEAHAEVAALAAAGSAAEGATLYVTLEPCSHQGKTPPCVDRIIERKIRRVVVSTQDPFRLVDGRGIERLRQAGIEVEMGILRDAAVLLNLSYFKKHILGDGVPAITLKAAVSLDGKISAARGERTDITSEQSRLWTHRLRAMHRSLLVGIETALIDRPRLDCRLPGVFAAPVPVVLDTRLRFPAAYRWPVEAQPFYIFTVHEADREREGALAAAGGTVVRCKESGGGVDIGDVLGRLLADGLGSCLVEGGGAVFSSFIERGLWDALYLFAGPSFFGPDGVTLYRSRTRAPLEAVAADARLIGNDILCAYLNESTRRMLADGLG
ncbi:MAG: bifunctional diaminohydroxyphosphoribosylaminopyrimidine deaminase/5-amino-6-(5-phosphoribosylamino)uracil reductase RibD [Chitinivibrionia bacterium]|nr:bifunctional diaminohydroxyphosphoribosylaminopyrimidine deaminase/5-amino-6-(5-phosphoribosylamino)uracil reductase RibD [Chitinivibrionia bacterium]